MTPVGLLTEGDLAIPLVVRGVIDDGGPRAIGEEDRCGFIEGRREAEVDVTGLDDDGFFGVADIIVADISADQKLVILLFRICTMLQGVGGQPVYRVVPCLSRLQARNK